LRVPPIGVHGHVAAEQGIIDAPLGKDDASPVAIKDCVRPGGAPAAPPPYPDRMLAGRQTLDQLDRQVVGERSLRICGKPRLEAIEGRHVLEVFKAIKQCLVIGPA